jgi:indolepyruvate ferredoxin oxidoreductase, beta subunit
MPVLPETNSQEFNVLMAGVGGQGIILMSELLGEAATADNLRVRGSEVLGMAVRGGSVTSRIRFGSQVYGPLIPVGKTHLMIATEPLEALRNVTSMSRSSMIVLNTCQVAPVPVLLGKARYPSIDEILLKLKRFSDKVVALDALELARQAGNTLSANIVMLGAAFGTGLVPIRPETIKRSIESRFKTKIAPLNLRAFDIGYRACQQILESG